MDLIIHDFVRFSVRQIEATSALLLAFVLASYPQIVGYWRFSMRSQEYYAKVADACDELIVRSSVPHHELKGADLKSLPAILTGLNPDHVIVETNLVLLQVGGGVVSHLIIWRTSEEDGALWKMSLALPENRTSRILFSRRRAQTANAAAAVDVPIASRFHLVAVCRRVTH